MKRAGKKSKRPTSNSRKRAADAADLLMAITSTRARLAVARLMNHNLQLMTRHGPAYDRFLAATRAARIPVVKWKRDRRVDRIPHISQDNS